MKKVTLKFLYRCNYQKKWEVENDWSLQTFEQQCMKIHICSHLNALYDSLSSSMTEKNYWFAQHKNIIIENSLTVLKEFKNFVNFLYNLFAVELITQKSYIEE